MDLERIKYQHGGTLLIIVVAMMIIAMVALNKCSSVEFTRRLDKQNDLSAQFDKVENALVNFVVQNKRLPCPADGRIASGVANAGVEIAFPACNTQQYGVVPWVSLGISEHDAIDTWGARISYRLDPALAGTVPLLMNMSNCDISGTGSVAGGGACRVPTPTCIANPATCTSPATFLVNKGLDVWDGLGGGGGWAARINNRPNGTGAAFLLISHGATGAGAYNPKGNYQPGILGPIPLVPPPGTQFAGNDEMPNINNQALSLPAIQATTFRDAPTDKTKTLTHFDDVVRHPTIQSILVRASLQERVH